MSNTINLLIIILLIVANGALSMSETALIASRKARLKRLAEEGNQRAQRTLDFASSPNLYLSTVQIGITLVSVLSGVFGGYSVAKTLAEILAVFPALTPYAETVSLSLVVAAISYLSLVLGELVPKRLALNNPEHIAMLVAGPMRFLSLIASPMVRFLAASTDLFLRLIRAKSPEEPPVTEEEIRILIDQATVAGIFHEAEQEMVERVFLLGDRHVGALMTPRRKITWLDIDDTLEKNLRKISKSAHSRFPVCQGRLGNIIGIIHVKDLISVCFKTQSLDLKRFLRSPLFVLETTHALHVLELFRESSNDIALIVDEYGTIEGLVTLTDILEAIVGDLPVHPEGDPPRIVRRQDGSWLIDGLLPIDELKEKFKIKQLPGEEPGLFQTVGGFVMTYLKKIPSAGDFFQCCGLRFEILDMDGQRVDKVLIEELEKEENLEES